MVILESLSTILGINLPKCGKSLNLRSNSEIIYCRYCTGNDSKQCWERDLSSSHNHDDRNIIGKGTLEAYQLCQELQIESLVIHVV